MLNLVWTAFFLIAIGTALFKWLALGQNAIFADLMQAVFGAAKLAFEIALGLTGVMALWLGMLRIGEQAGFLQLMTRALTPLFRRLMPEVPSQHPALGAVTMNMAANMLGLDNAATPMGIAAMRELQTLNPHPDTASNAQILFLVINASSITLLPVTILTYRAQLGAADPADVFIPILLATYCSTLAGLIAVSWMQRIRLLDPVVLAYLGGISAGVAGLAVYFGSLPAQLMQAQSSLLSNLLLLSLISAFLLGALRRRVDAYAAFVEGAREGFNTAVTIIPYLVAMLVAIALLRAAGVLDALAGGMRWLVELGGWDSRWVDALPTMLAKPLSGSGARAMMIDTMSVHGPDSFAGRLASIVQGSTETTFYVLAVYLGAVNLRRARHALGCALVADAAGMIAAVAVTYLFFG